MRLARRLLHRLLGRDTVALPDPAHRAPDDLVMGPAGPHHAEAQALRSLMTGLTHRRTTTEWKGD